MMEFVSARLWVVRIVPKTHLPVMIVGMISNSSMDNANV